jgi:hypothetical protein
MHKQNLDVVYDEGALALAEKALVGHGPIRCPLAGVASME